MSFRKTLALTTALSTFGAAAYAEQIWDMAMAYPANNYHTENAAEFASEVEECTGGSLKMTIHANGSLFKGNEIKQAVQRGQAQIGERLLSAHANENEIFAYDSVPFLASSFELSDKLRDAARETLGQVLAEQNLTLLYSVPWPAQGLYFNTEVNSVSDIAGVRFRAYNSATARVAELAGMVPVQIEAADLKQALATGVVASLISSGSTGTEEKVWEDLSHFYDAKAWLPRNTVMANSEEFNALTDVEKNCLLEAASAAETRGSATAAELEQSFLDELAANGMVVVAPAGKFAEELATIGETMTSEWLESTGDAGAAIVSSFKGE